MVVGRRCGVPYGMTTAVKLCVSVPGATFRALEATRRRRRVTRSALVAEALDALFAAALDARDASYVRGYTRRPERASDAASAAAAVLSTWSTSCD